MDLSNGSLQRGLKQGTLPLPPKPNVFFFLDESLLPRLSEGVSRRMGKEPWNPLFGSGSTWGPGRLSPTYVYWKALRLLSEPNFHIFTLGDYLSLLRRRLFSVPNLQVLGGHFLPPLESLTNPTGRSSRWNRKLSALRSKHVPSGVP